MSYTVIARRWRPKRFEDVVGQSHVVTTLKNSIRRGRIAHAYLFAGPRGVGKTSISRILAKAVNCVEGIKEEPCNACKTCVAIDTGGFVDVIEIDAASNRGIDEIRELRETVRYLPMDARYKVYIIDEAHMLTEAAFNALLKTLEEPPGHNIFVLATTEMQKIPYTIMSRCQRFDFRRISESHIIEQLKRILIDEEIDYEEKVLSYIVREADGSLRDAESILDQVIAYSGKRLTEADTIGVIGVVQREVAYAIVKSIVEQDAKRGIQLIADSLEQGHDAYQVYKGLVSFLRDLLMIKVWDDKPPFVYMDDEEQKKVKELLKSVEYYDVQNMLHHLLKGEDVVRGMFPKISLEVLFIDLYNLSQLRSVEAMLDDRPVERAGRVAPPSEVAPLSKVAPPSEAPEPFTSTLNSLDLPSPPLEQATHPLSSLDGERSRAAKAEDFPAYLLERNKMLAGFLGTFSTTAEGSTIVISLDKGGDHVKNNAAATGELKKHAADFFGRDMSIRFLERSGDRTDSIDDYMKEAELLFKI